MTGVEWGRIGRVAGNVALWIAAVLGAASLILGLASVALGIQPLIFRSSSMSPAIDAGALALAKTIPAADVVEGDVVSVVGDSGVRVTHRVVEIGEVQGDQRTLILQGDANAGPDADPYVVAQVDRVFVDVPYLGYLANWLASPWALFVAGAVISLLIASFWVKPIGRGTVSALAVVAAAGLAAGTLTPPPTTEAYFSDPARFEAGTIQAHQVRIFDLADADQCVQDGNAITVNARVASPRYRMVWYRVGVGAPISGSSIKTISPTGAANDPVAIPFSKAEVASTNGSYDLVGISQLKGSATAPWRSAQERRVGVRIDSTGIRCGTTNLPPTVSFVAPRDDMIYASTTAVEIETIALCLGRKTPCGTVSDSDGISSVDYRLQRSNGWGTRCWNPAASSFTLTGCGTWRGAETIPSSPGNVAGNVVWRIPEGLVNDSTFDQSGEYTLYLRVRDNASPQAVTERTIRFTVR